MQVLSNKDSHSLKEEFREWIEASETGDKQPLVLYMNQIEHKF